MVELSPSNNMWQKIIDRWQNFSTAQINGLIFALLAIILMACSWSLFQPHIGYTHDYLHGARILEMSIGLREGQFPVIWSQNFAFGYGMPLFEFYAPLPYLVGALFHLLGLSVTNSVKMLFLISNIFTIWGAYLLGKKLTSSPWAGILIAAGIALAPYRAVDLFVRGALSEAWAIMALPWILLGTCLVIDKAKKGWLLLSISLATLMLSHNISVLITFPFLLLFALIYILGGYDWDKFFTSTARHKWSDLFSNIFQHGFNIFWSYLLAIGLASFYLFPAFIEKDFTQVANYVINDYFNYKLHFLYIRQFMTINWGYGGSGWGPDDGMSFYLGLVQILSIPFLLICLTLYFGQLLSNRIIRSASKYKLGAKLRQWAWLSIGSLFILIFSLYMTTMKAQPVWNLLSSLLAFIQFPWRYLALSLIFSGLIIGFVYQFLPRIFKLIFFIISFSLLVFSNALFFQSEKYLDGESSFYYENAALTRGQMSGILVDYLPTGFQLFTDPPQLASQLLPDTFAAGALSLQLDRATEKIINSNINSPASSDASSELTPLTLNLAAYPNWSYEIDGVKHPELITISEDGLVVIQVPSGQHQLGVYLSDTPLRLASKIITLLSILVIIWLNFELVLPVDFYRQSASLLNKVKKNESKE